MEIEAGSERTVFAEQVVGQIQFNKIVQFLNTWKQNCDLHKDQNPAHMLTSESSRRLECLDTSSVIYYICSIELLTLVL